MKLDVMSANGQTNIRLNFEKDRLKNSFQLFLMAIKIGACTALDFFSNIFQIDGLSKVENIT